MHVLEWIATEWRDFFWTQAWGNLAEWVGGLGAVAAFWAAVAIFWSDRKEKNRAQASLVYVSNNGATVLTVYNRSDKAIFDVRAVLSPMKMVDGVTTNEFQDGRVMSSSRTVYSYPSHEFFLIVRQILKKRGQEYSSSTTEETIEIEAGKKLPINVPELLNAATECHVIFRDAQGKDWAINVRTRKLEKAHRGELPRTVIRSNIAARWWLTKRYTRWFWDNYLYYPKGRPPPLD